MIRDFDWPDQPALRALRGLTGQSVPTEDELRATLAHGPGLVVVAAHPGAGVVGVVLGTSDGRRGWIHRLAVHPDVRRTGLATALVAEIERRPADLGAPRIDLPVPPGNDAALAFWPRLGYPPQPDVLCSEAL